MPAGTWDRKEAERQALERIERQDQAVNHPAQRGAMDQLKRLLGVPGALQIITNVPDPKGAAVGPRHPEFWICHEVVRLEGPDHNGNMWAYSKNDEDYCKGNALALLGRLTQAGRSEPFVEDREELSSGPEKLGIEVPKPLSRD